MRQAPSFAPLTLTDYISQMRIIPGGTFQMGSNLIKDQKPVHTVRLSNFRMGATPVTVGMWEEYVKATGGSMPPEPNPKNFNGERKFNVGWTEKDHPIVNVSWEAIAGKDGAPGYCEWASRQSGLELDLPTEAQWEYCARDRGREIEFPWGNRVGFDRAELFAPELKAAVEDGMIRPIWSSEDHRAQRTAPVVRAEHIHVNSLGLSDMAGNVWQWCSDWYGDYLPGKVTDPSGPNSGMYRCVRGGSWGARNLDVFRCAFRAAVCPKSEFSSVGFRLSIGPL